MENLIAFFSDVPTWFRSLVLIGGIIFFWSFEGLIPLFKVQYKKTRHAGINLFFTLTTAIINLGFAGLLLLTADFVTVSEFGVLHLFIFPVWVETIIGLLILDLIGAYLVHWVEHKVKWMWKFHLIHHTDTHVDVTTGLRHHPGESVFRFTFTIIATLIVGAPIWMVMLYQSLSVLLTHFNHANINISKRLDSILSYMIVTPNMHKVHHHYTQPLTDSNYGNIFSFWDRLFGTFIKVKNTEQLVYGIDTHMKPEENNILGNLLKIPFQPYRAPREIENEVEIEN